jgi:hypothetical protein
MMQPSQANAESTWQLAHGVARLGAAGLSATVNLAAPQRGLTSLTVFGQAIGGHILGVEFPQAAPARGPAVTECYQRGNDLVATYEQTEGRPFRATVYWRAEGLAISVAGVAVELIVSVQTSLLDATPQLQSLSQIIGGNHLAYPRSAEKAGSESEGSRPRGSFDHLSECVRLRIGEPNVTYCEMIHPSDWRGLQASEGAGGIELSWSLVGHFMEKGVIRRLRVRGIFLQGTPEDARIRELYDEFAASPPPLTT